ncbi:MAG: hypothetical protein ACM3ML_04865 [Micromonosporaceae bacterium]
MSLPTSQQRILDGIEDGLRAHDLRLVSLFATFTRLTRQEEMPKVEQLKPAGATSPRPGLLRPPGLPRSPGLMRRPGAVGTWRTGRPDDGTPWIMLVPIVLVAALSALVLGLLISAHQAKCAPGVTSLAAGSSVSRSSGCPVRQVPNAHPSTKPQP